MIINATLETNRRPSPDITNLRRREELVIRAILHSLGQTAMSAHELTVATELAASELPTEISPARAGELMRQALMLGSPAAKGSNQV